MRTRYMTYQNRIRSHLFSCISMILLSSFLLLPLLSHSSILCATYDGE
ncbi:hypothetical protein MtrunA17_Chr4g0055381 [Medicago truncatula]|uniref:Uncharacterized protein n=1 Tax=Medicago truncatula TaxID=3880 RepID=A0A396IEF2_MEDTR|nr:hypothetical protein MtrunA17_Chr4g0055381 [Medicago truncatula]